MTCGVTPEMLDAMMAAGLTAEQIVTITKASLAAVEAKAEAARERKRAGNATRQQRWRDRRKSITHSNALCDVTERDPSLNDAPTLLSSLEPTLNPPKERTPKGVPKKTQNRWPEGSFDRIWEAYPHKVGKKAAIAKLQLLERCGEVSPDVILAGIESYKLSKPAHHDWKNPATWLNQGCWSDEYAPPAATGPPPSPAQPSLTLVNGASHVQADRRKSAFAEELARRKAANPYFQRGG